MKILITGARGMVGSALCKVLDGHELITPARYQLNVGNLEQVMSFKKESPECIIHLAAETDHEYCDMNPANCYFINTVGTANMVRLAQVLDIPILYLSAGSIFDGKKEAPYEINDKPQPINHYNYSKYLAEIHIGAYQKHFIVRAGWMFGGGPKIDKKFVNKIITKINRGDKVISVADDCIGSPTYAFDLSQRIKYLIFTPNYGTYHIVNEGAASRYEIAVEMIKILDLQKYVSIVPVGIDDLKEEFPCKRTNYEVLKPTIPARTWQEALKEYLNAEYRH